MEFSIILVARLLVVIVFARSIHCDFECFGLQMHKINLSLFSKDDRYKATIRFKNFSLLLIT